MCGRRRASTSVVGNLLLVAIVLILGSAVALTGFGFLEQVGAPTADAAFEYEQTPAGLSITPVATRTDVEVRLNGDAVATLGANSAGESVLLPTAPGDRITVVSRDADREVLVNREVDERSEVGDFISYYRFNSGSGATLEDRSGNDNDGTLLDDGGTGGPRWGGCGLEFDGSGDYVTVPDITTGGVDEVSEFTVAVAFRQTGSRDRVNQLIEHQFGGGEEWFIETSQPDPGEPYSDGYSVDYAVEYDDEVASSTAIDTDTRHVVVGTYDGAEYQLFVDGQLEAAGEHSEAVEMGAMRVGRDFEQNDQYLEGEICEIRLYYTAFEGEQIERITEVMD